MRIRVYAALGALVVLAGCGDDEAMNNPVSGAGTMAPVTGGMGVAGTTMAGAGVITGGTGGMTGGTGSSTGGTMAAPVAVPGCEVADTTIPPAMLHAGALEALAAPPPTSSCGGSTSCHQGNGKAGLSLLNAPDLNMLMVGKASCEVPMMPVVSSMGGQAGLDGSWLWIKITAPVDASGVLMNNAAWGTPGNCGQTPNTFGVRMPWGNTDKMLLKDSALAQVRNWICAGAPGPS